MEKAKNVRRAAKGCVTRAITTVNTLIEAKRPGEEVRDALKSLTTSFEALAVKHEDYTMFLNDEEFTEAEVWMEDCTHEFNQCNMIAKDYVNDDKQKNENNGSQGNGNMIAGEVVHQNEAVSNGPNDYVNADATNVNVDNGEVNVNDVNVNEESSNVDESEDKNGIEVGSQVSNAIDREKQPILSISLKHEKPKLPVFNGDVRKYFIFKDDFKHAIESRLSERDTITILRTCLGAEPAKLIEGISNDLKTVWKYLDQVYGDPRVVSDVVTSDLERFKPIQPGEDHRFCELVNLVRRSYNILKEIKRPQDIDNTHVISLIERKLIREDQRVWARSLNQQKKEPSMSTLLEWLEEEMGARMRSSAAIRKSTAHAAKQSTVNTVSSREGPTAMRHSRNTAKRKEKPACYVCQSQHYVDECPRFLEMSASERWKVVKDKKACFCCLKYSKDHSALNCRKRRECGDSSQGVACKMFHHKLLHSESGNALSVTEDQGVALLPTSVAVLKGEGQLETEVNVLFDSGAQVSMIRNSVAEAMGLTGRKLQIYLTKIGGIEEEHDTWLYKVTLCRQNKTPVQTIQAIGIPHISNEVTKIKVDDIAVKFNIPVNEIKRRAGPIDVLIGITYPKFHVGKTEVKDGLVARKSPLGWVIFGMNSNKSNESKQVLHIRVATPVDVTEFWKTESMGVNVQPCNCKPDEMSTQERKELKLIEQSCELKEKRWTISYPWKKDANLLPNNYEQVLKKLECTEKRLLKSPDYAESYDIQIKEMEKLGFSRKLEKEEIKSYKGPVHYIAHHAVVRLEKKSTPVRIVFNSSANYKGHCLNDYWHKGPDLLNGLFGVILRFRENPVAISADISKMYHMIAIPTFDQHVHRFLWRNLEVGKEPDTYVKTVLTFGDRPSPAMAIVALQKIAKLKEEDEPKAAETIIKNTYMDDICDSVNSVAEADKLMSAIDNVLDIGGFKVKGWISNATKENSSKEVTIGLDEEAEKVLGVIWKPKEDKFSYKVKVDPTFVEMKSKSLTKRKILSQIASIFDPIGAGAPVLIKTKIAMQQLWQHGLNWDEEVPDIIKQRWIELFNELVALNGFNFDRCLRQFNAIEDPWLVVFCDASRLAFGACAYVRWRLANGKLETRFVAAKTRVSPLKELTIPRLELQAAVLASRLAKTIYEQSRFNFARSIYFTDSLVALAWIQSQSRCYKPFVSCRIGEIQSNSEPSEWKYCPTQLNVADDLTKGISVKDLTGRWINGPAFLKQPESEWPSQQRSVDMTEVNKERRKPTLVQAVNAEEHILRCEDFSTWKKLLRVTAYVKRFIKNCAKRNSSERQFGPLEPQECKDAEDYWVRRAQLSLHQRIQKGELASLTPFIDGSGIIKVGARTDPTLMSYDNQHAILLPYGQWISTLITRDAHQYGHTGIATTTAKVRKKYWIIKGNVISKRVKQQCTFCRKLEAKVSTQFMADLPLYRQQPFTPPFLYTACDYFGPITVKIGRNRRRKHYGVIFTCLNTRAVHCELAVYASSIEFLQVLRRFFAQRGYPKLIMSDNGTQMVGAEKELCEMIKGWDKTKLKEYCADRGMKWQFTTPLAPHQNRCAESMVKSIKIALKKAIGDTVLTPFELYTCIVEAANLVNQRPIGRIPNDPNEGSYLCPNDILLGRCSSKIPQGPFRETNNPRHRFEFCQKIVDTFWKRWSRDVLPSLVMRRKWQRKERNAQVGDYVAFLKEDNEIRGKWCVGRIVSAFPGADGIVRNVAVKTSESSYKRPVQKICVIYPVEGFD